jgi:non-specific serine/threonine protein kinase
MEPADSPSLCIKLLGRFEVWREGTLLPAEAWPQAKTQALLKLLASERGRLFKRDEILEALFPDLDPEKAAQNLHGRLSELRRALEPRLKKGTDSQFILSQGKQGYCFSKDASCWIDTEVFERRCAQAQSAEQAGKWSEALEHYQTAIALYSGEYLPEDRYEEWAGTFRDRWRERYVNALSGLAECRARQGDYLQAIEDCKKAIEIKPTCENIYRQQMLLQYLTGQKSEALQTYQRCLRVLQEQLDVIPAQETQKLYEAISQDQVEGINGIYPRPAGVPASKHNLPNPVSSFIGREKERTKIKWELAQTRLLTLKGAGGSGKTRLALQVACELVKEYPHGVWWVELASLTDGVLVAQTVATTLGVKEEPKRPLIESLINYLKARNLLLVLDNCEHLIGACAAVVEKVLLACPQLQVLATSREPLGIVGETIWLVPALSLPESDNALPPTKILLQYEAVSLFVERAISHLPSFELHRENVSTVVQICRQLDGMPLAIELAAARVKLLSLEQIAERLSDRFRFLTGGGRTAQPRQQTLKAAIDWGFDLLSDQEKRLFSRLSVFVGGFSIEAAEGVCVDEQIDGGDSRIAPSAILDLIAQLVDKSFVVVERKGKETRYRLLETMRQYGSEKLSQSSECTEMAQRHACWFLALGEKAVPELNGPYQAEWFDRLEMEHDNLRTALRWFSQSASIEMGMRLALRLPRFWEVRGYWCEGQRWLHDFLEKDNNQMPSKTRAEALRGMGSFVRMQGDFSKARALYQEALALFRTLDDKRGIAHALGSLGTIAWEQGNYAESHQHHQESLRLKRELGDKSGIAATLSSLAVNAFEQGDYELARTHFSEALGINRELGDSNGVAANLGNLGVILQHQNDYVTARQHYEESLSIHRGLGNKRFIAISLHRLGSLAHMQQDYEASRALPPESLAIRQELGDATNSAWSHYHLGRAARCLKDFDVAQAHHRESLAHFQKLGVKQGILFNLRGMAALEVALGNYERALRIGAVSEHFRESVGFVFPPNEQAEFEQDLTETRAALGEEAFSKVWQEQQALTIEQAIEYALSEST